MPRSAHDSLEESVIQEPGLGATKCLKQSKKGVIKGSLAPLAQSGFALVSPEAVQLPRAMANTALEPNPGELGQQSVRRGETCTVQKLVVPSSPWALGNACPV